MKHGPKSPSLTHGDIGHALNKKHNDLMAGGPVIKIEISKPENEDDKKDDGLAPDGSHNDSPELMLAEHGSPEHEGDMQDLNRDKILEDMINTHTDHVKPNSLEGKSRSLMMKERDRLKTKK